ncbi:YDG/SRA domain-containing protein [Kitasatospora sp. NPDC127121]|uniref:YDG/SRA domain-containing protein n=1 Tax=Kitasatospora sp. NPDC127121 TaxID=3345371 RepID=UPI0036342AC4
MARRLPLSGTGPLVSFARELREFKERSRGTVETVVALGASRTAVYAALNGSRLPSAKNLDAMVEAWGSGSELERRQWHDRRRAAEEGLVEAARRQGTATAGRTPEEEDFTRALRGLWNKVGDPSTERVARHCDLSARTLDSYLDGRTIPTESRLRELFDGLSALRADDSAWLAATRDTFIGEVLFRAQTARQEERARVRELATALPEGQAPVEFGPLPDGIGPVPGVRLGQEFDNRRTLSLAGVHRPLQAGICGLRELGAESIVVSGGYQDDEDLGDVILYTGEGGRSPQAGQPARNQQLTRGNAALATSAATGAPVRVVRGVTTATRSFYRYDGLFRVEDLWSETSSGGFLVWRFRLVALSPAEQAAAVARVSDRVSDRVTAPVAAPVTDRVADRVTAPTDEDGREAGPVRSATSVERVVRNTAIATHVKRAHDYTCQVCGVRMAVPGGAYAEAAHITPLGSPHNGSDTVDNVLCLCANHHVLFDFGMLIVNDDLTVVSRDDSSVLGWLRETPDHVVDRKRLAEHRLRHGVPRHEGMR